jgi:hypothetical protein
MGPGSSKTLSARRCQRDETREAPAAPRSAPNTAAMFESIWVRRAKKARGPLSNRSHRRGLISGQHRLIIRSQRRSCSGAEIPILRRVLSRATRSRASVHSREWMSTSGGNAAHHAAPVPTRFESRSASAPHFDGKRSCRANRTHDLFAPQLSAFASTTRAHSLSQRLDPLLAAGRIASSTWPQRAQRVLHDLDTRLLWCTTDRRLPRCIVRLNAL